MDKTDRLRDYGLAFLLYEQSLGICGYELIRELFIFIKLILNSYLVDSPSYLFSVSFLTAPLTGIQAAPQPTATTVTSIQKTSQ